MAAITIEVAAAGARIKDLVAVCNATNRERGGVTSHGELTVERLLVILVEDAAMIISWPGAWEATGIADLLARHGYRP